MKQLIINKNQLLLLIIPGIIYRLLILNPRKRIQVKFKLEKCIILL